MKPPPGAGPSNRVMDRRPTVPADTGEDDDALVARARGGDRGAFRALVERHSARVHALAWRITRSAPDAEEVAQDAWVRVWLALGGFRGESKFTTWLYRIVTRRAFDRAQMLKRRSGRETVLEAADNAAVERPEIGNPGLERAMAELTEMQRAVVTLYYFQDQSVMDVATVLGIPTGTVKTHLSRARATLKERLESMERSAQ